MVPKYCEMLTIIVFSLNVDRNRIAWNMHDRPAAFLKTNYERTTSETLVGTFWNMHTWIRSSIWCDVWCDDVVRGHALLLLPTEKSTKLKLLTIFFIPLMQVADIILFFSHVARFPGADWALQQWLVFARLCVLLCPCISKRWCDRLEFHGCLLCAQPFFVTNVRNYRVLVVTVTVVRFVFAA